MPISARSHRRDFRVAMRKKRGIFLIEGGAGSGAKTRYFSPSKGGRRYGHTRHAQTLAQSYGNLKESARRTIGEYLEKWESGIEGEKATGEMAGGGGEGTVGANDSGDGRLESEKLGNGLRVGSGLARLSRKTIFTSWTARREWQGAVEPSSTCDRKNEILQIFVEKRPSLDGDAGRCWRWYRYRYRYSRTRTISRRSRRCAVAFAVASSQADITITRRVSCPDIRVCMYVYVYVYMYDATTTSIGGASGHPSFRLTHRLRAYCVLASALCIPKTRQNETIALFIFGQAD